MEGVVGSPLTVNGLVLDLLIGLLLSLLVAWYYTHFGHALSNRRQFARQLPALTLTTGVVISIVRSSVALSLGMAGALFIVRFRAPIKEPEELVFLFIAIAIGLGIGAGQLLVTFVGVLIVMGYMGIGVLAGRKATESNMYLNLQIDEGAAPHSLLGQVHARLLTYAEQADFRRMDSRDGSLELTYFVRCRTPQKLDALIDDLKSHFGVRELSFIQQDQALIP